MSVQDETQDRDAESAYDEMVERLRNQTMRKSSPPGKPINGDVAKYLSYREAWTRIALAQEHGFSFEAITILESIITDRLQLYLAAVGVVTGTGHEGLGLLIRRWQEVHPEPITTDGIENLQAAVDLWRVARNRAIHGIVRSPARADASRIDEFLTDTQKAVTDGVALAKVVGNWSKRATRLLVKANEN